jgi:hypothetical protein
VVLGVVGGALRRTAALLAGGVAPGVVAARVIDGAFAAAGWARQDLGQVAQLVRMATVTVEILLLRARAVLGTLPELAQVGVGVAGGVVSAQRARHGGVACRGDSATCSSPEFVRKHWRGRRDATRNLSDKLGNLSQPMDSFSYCNEDISDTLKIVDRQRIISIQELAQTLHIVTERTNTYLKKNQYR